MPAGQGIDLVPSTGLDEVYARHAPRAMRIQRLLKTSPQDFLRLRERTQRVVPEEQPIAKEWSVLQPSSDQL